MHFVCMEMVKYFVPLVSSCKVQKIQDIFQIYVCNFQFLTFLYRIILEMSGRDKTEVTIDFKTGDKERPKDSKGPAPVKYANVKFLKSFFFPRAKSRFLAADLPNPGLLDDFSQILL